MLTGKYVLNLQNENFNFKPIGVQDIGETMVKKKTYKSFRSDEMSSYFLKLAIPCTERSLVFILNASLDTSHFPDLWKIALITPIFIEGGSAKKSNYRPILVLPILPKLFEKLVFNQLYQYRIKNDLIHPVQSGSLKRHSTLTCLRKSLVTGTTGWTLVRRWIQFSLILKKQSTL